MSDPSRNLPVSVSQVVEAFEIIALANDRIERSTMGWQERQMARVAFDEIRSLILREARMNGIEAAARALTRNRAYRELLPVRR